MAQARQRTPPSEKTVKDGECPECGGDVIGQEERVCGGCGLVASENTIDRSRKWKKDTESGQAEAARTGPPTSLCFHDRNLQSQIGKSDWDANGKALSARQRHQANRLRRVSRWGKISSGREETLRKALDEAQRLTCALGLPKYVTETASVIVRQCREQDLFQGRCIESVAAAAVSIGSRQHSVVRSMSEVATVSSIGEKEILRCLRYVSSELEIAVEPADPAQFVSQFVSELEMGKDVERLSTALIERGKESREDGLSGRNPVSVAAGAIYLAGCTLGEEAKRTQAEISATADVSPHAIRDAHRALDSECDVTELSDSVRNPMK